MIIAVDTGATKTIVGRFNTDGELLDFRKFPTPQDISDYCQQTVSHIKNLAGDQSIATIALAIPGVVRDGTVVWSANLGWRDLPIQATFQQLFPEAMIFVDNDANLAGIASMRRLATVPRCGLYVTIGTGIGTAVVLDGQIHPALRECEGGHMIVSYQGHEDSWEQLAAGPALTERFGMISDDTAAEAWPEIAERISIGLSALVAFIQPDVVVLGGGIGKFTDRFSGLLSGLLAERLPAHTTLPHIVSAPHPELTVIYGCYDRAIAR